MISLSFEALLACRPQGAVPIRALLRACVCSLCYLCSLVLCCCALLRFVYRRWASCRRAGAPSCPTRTSCGSSPCEHRCIFSSCFTALSEMRLGSRLLPVCGCGLRSPDILELPCDPLLRHSHPRAPLVVGCSFEHLLNAHANDASSSSQDENKGEKSSSAVAAALAEFPDAVRRPPHPLSQ